MVTLSVCMIVKNEEDVLERCLNCAKKIADEIIIVDTGSTDKTKEIARKFSDKVYDFKWCYDFSKARNYSFSKATMDYIMWLDADDVILDEDINKILKLKEELSNKNVDIVNLKYNIGLDEYDRPTLSYYRERILRREKNYKWVSPIHEVIIQSGVIISKDIAITHKKIKKCDPKRNLNIFEKMIDDGIKLDARQKFYYARELYYNKEYDKSISMYKEFFKDKSAWIENKISACIDLSNIYEIKKDEENKMKYLLKSMEYDFPRAQVCCLIGNNFFNKNNYNIAIKWYKLATTLDENLESGGFYSKIYKEYIPYLMLCVCYDRLGNHLIANEYNEKAGKYNKNDKVYLKNKEYFEKILKDKNDQLN